MKPARFGKRLKVKEDIDTLWDIHQSQKEEIFKTLGIEKPASFESTIAERKNAIEEVCPEYKDILKKLVDISANLILKTPPKYIFHDFEHTFIYVLSQTEELLENSDLNSEEKKVVYIAAIAHDLGHLIGREDHEKYSKRIVQKLMERYEVSDKEKEAINLVITSTKFPHAPELNIDEELKTQYQKIQTMIYIMRDADIGHIASSNFEGYVQQYIKYLCESIILKPRDPQKGIEWRGQNLFHNQLHSYKTQYGKNVRATQKQQNLQQLETIRDELRSQLEKQDFNYESIKANRKQIRSNVNKNKAS